MSTLLPIGEVVKRSGVAASALRFSEERGLIASERAGCRLANPDDRAGRLGPGPRYWVGDRPAAAVS